MSRTSMITAPRRSTSTGLLSSLDRLPLLPWSTLFGLLTVRTVLLFAVVALIGAVAPETWPAGLIAVNALIIVVDLATILLVIMVLHRRDHRLSDVLGRLGPAWLPWTLLVMLIVLVGFLAMNLIGNLVAYGGPPPVTEGLGVPLWVGIGAIPAALTIGVAEEVLYRGLGQDQLTRRLGRLRAWLIVAAFFAVQHVPLALISGPAVLSKVIMTFGVGLLLGALMIWRRRLWPLIVAHVVVDLLFLGLPTLLGALS